MIRSLNKFILLFGLIVLWMLICYHYVSKDVFIKYWNFYLLSGFILLISIIVMNHTAGLINSKYITLQTLPFCGFVLMIFIPGILNYTPSDFRSFSYKLPVTIFQISLLVSLISYSLGAYVTNVAKNFKPIEHVEYFNTNIIMPRYKYNLTITLIISFLSFGLFIAYLFHNNIELSKYPLFQMFATQDTDTLALSREFVFKLLDPRWSDNKYSFLFYFYLALRMWLFPFLTIYTLLCFLVSRKYIWLAIFIIDFSVAIFYAALSIARAPVAALIMRISVAWYYYKKSSLNKKLLVLMMIMIVSFPIIITTIAYNKSDFVFGLYGVARRLFFTPADDLLIYFQAFPIYFDFQYGMTILKPFYHLIGHDHFYIENEIYHYQFPFSNVPTGHANAAFLSNFFADFGVLGVSMGSFLVGSSIQYINIKLVRSRRDVMNVTIYAYLVYALWIINFGSLTSVIGTNGVIFIISMPVIYSIIDFIINNIIKFQKVST